MTRQEILDAINESGNHFKFDKNINLSTLVALIILIGTIARYGNSAVSYLSDIKSKTNVMWYYFVQDHPDAEKLLERLK